MKTFLKPGLRAGFCLCLLSGFWGEPLQVNAQNPITNAPATDELPVTLVEVRYDKLMRMYLNKIKLAFSEPDDTRSLEILNQFLGEFSQKTDGLKTELQALVKDLSPQEAEVLYNRISDRSHTPELVALLFDTRVTSRMSGNQELKHVMDRLHAKSLEVEGSEREFIASGR